MKPVNNTIKDLLKKVAYKVVLKDLMKIPLFSGKYDAENGKIEFMYGVLSVMEGIAFRAGEKDWDAFQDIFIENILKSKERAKK